MKSYITMSAMALAVAVSSTGTAHAQSISPTITPGTQGSFTLRGDRNDYITINRDCRATPDITVVRQLSYNPTCTKNLEQVLSVWMRARIAAGVDERRVGGVYGSLQSAIARINQGSGSMGWGSRGRSSYYQQVSCATIVSYTPMQRICSATGNTDDGLAGFGHHF